MMVKDKSQRDLSTFLVFPFLVWRIIHNQLWITLSRYRTAKGNNRIVDKGIEFDQVDRERDWLVCYIYASLTIFLNPLNHFIKYIILRIMIICILSLYVKKFINKKIVLKIYFLIKLMYNFKKIIFKS